MPVRAGLAGGGRRAWLTHPFVPAREAGAAALGRGRSGGPVRRLPRPFVSVCIEVLGWLGVAVPERRPRLLVTDRAREASGALLAAAGLAPGEPYLLANAASRPGSAKGVPPASFAAALDAIARATDLPVVVAGAPGEEGPAREIAERAVVARTFLLDAPAPGVAELAALAGAARLAVGPDNGARHVAEALATPCVVLCGPTDPRHTSEHAATTRILRVEVPCGPCHRERCPLAGERKHACMTGIEPSAIAAAAAELLG